MNLFERHAVGWAKIRVAHRDRIIRIVLMILVATMCQSARADEPVAAMEIDRQAYHVELRVAWANCPSFALADREAWTARLRNRLERSFAAAWDMKIVPGEGFTRKQLATGNSEQLTACLPNPPTDADVVVLMLLDEPGAGQRVTLRILQPKLPRISPPVVLETHDPRGLVDQTASAIQTTFRAEALIEQVRDQSALLRVRAGELAPAEGLLPTGSTMTVSIRYSNRQGEVQRVQPVPWTCLSVTDGERAWGMAKIHSGLKAALGGKTRGRVELLAVTVRADYAESEVQFVTQTKPPSPLIAQRVQIADRPWQPAVQAEPQKGEPPGEPTAPAGSEVNGDEAIKAAGPARDVLTDRLGRIRVMANPAEPLVWLNVFSGSAVLARVPYIPGSEPLATLELPDDAIRLKVEGELGMLQSQLVEVVAQRSTVLSAIRRMSRQNQLDRVGDLLKEFDTLPDDKQFNARLGVIRLNGQEQARKQRQKSVEARIHRMCDDAGVLIKRYLDPDKRKVVEEELAELRRFATQDRKELEANERKGR